MLGARLVRPKRRNYISCCAKDNFGDQVGVKEGDLRKPRQHKKRDGSSTNARKSSLEAPRAENATSGGGHPRCARGVLGRSRVPQGSPSTKRHAPLKLSRQGAVADIIVNWNLSANSPFLSPPDHRIMCVYLFFLDASIILITRSDSF